MSIPQQTRWAALAVAGLTAFSAPAWADKVRLATSMGEIVIELDAQKAPKSVANFEQYVKEGHYNGTVFHRVIPNFMIQGGDPKGDGTGDPGYKFKNETSTEVTFDKPGRLAYANSGPDTNGSQFFITEVPYESLNGGYTIFGQCDDAAVELVKQIARMARDPRNDMPFRPIKITHITIVKPGATAGTAHPATPATKKPAATTPKPAPQS